MISAINALAALWWGWILPLTLQLAVLGAAIYLADLFLARRGWPQVRYALWALVFLKLLLPPSLALDTSVSSRIAALWNRESAVTISSPAVSSPAIVPPALPMDFAAETATGNFTGAAASDGVPTPFPERMSFEAILFIIWLSVIAALAAMLILKMRGLRRLAATGGSADWAFEPLQQAAERIGLKSLPQVVATAELSSAAVFGVARPIIFIPGSWRETLLPRNLSHIFLHELAHIRRLDLAANAAQTILHVVFWFHPFVWLAGRRTRELRELCCDATVAQTLRAETVEYRQTLIEAGRRILAVKSPLSLGLLGLFETHARLRTRLEHLSRPLWKYRLLRQATTVAVVAAMMLFVIPMAATKAAPAAAPGTPTTSVAEGTLTTPQPVVTPASGGSIKGTLTTDDPAINLDGITVTAWQMDVKGKASTKTTKASKDGSFSIDGLEPGRYQVNISVDKESRLVTKIFKEVNVASGEAVSTSLGVVKGAPVRGRVVDKATRKPLTAGKGLVIAKSVGKDLAFGGDIDKDGFYEIALAPGGWGFTGEYKDAEGKTVPDWDSTRDIVVKSGENMVVGDIEVSTSREAPGVAGKIAGKVVAADGTLDVSGLPVIAIPGTHKTGDVRTAVTEKDGSFTMDDLVPGEYQVDLQCVPDRAAVEEQINQVTVAANKTAELTISAVRGALVSGRAVDAATRKPLDTSDGVSIVFVKNADGGGTTAYGGKVQEGGTYKYRLVPATYRVLASMQDATGKAVTLETSKPTVTLKAGEEVTMPDVLVTMPGFSAAVGKIAGAPPLSAGTHETPSPLPAPPSDLTPTQTPQWQVAQQQLASDLNQRALAMGVKGPRVYTIRGRVVDNRLDISSENLARFESAATEDELGAPLKKMLGGGPARGVVVVLRSGEITRETTTDSDGGFTFSGVPDGPCELSVQGDSAAAPAKQAMSRAQVVVGSVTLQLRNDWVTVSGHVRDATGRGVAGAKVTGVRVSFEESGHEWVRRSEEYSTVTDATGYYEFEGLEPESAYKIAYSAGGYSALMNFEIQSAADGLKSGIVRVPLVSEDLVELARPLYEAGKRFLLRHGGPLPNNLKDPSPVSSSKGNRITNVDIVLNPASTKPTVTLKAGEEVTMPDVLVTMPAKK